MSGVITLRQRPAQIDDLGAQLLEHFTAARSALLGGQQVVIDVSGADLLGQGEVADAAVASALLGLARSLAIEGASAGWSINVVARDAGGAQELDVVIAEGVSGQLAHLDRGHLGRLPS